MGAYSRLLFVPGRMALPFMTECSGPDLPMESSFHFLCIAACEDLSLTCPYEMNARPFDFRRGVDEGTLGPSTFCLRSDKGTLGPWPLLKHYLHFPRTQLVLICPESRYA